MNQNEKDLAALLRLVAKGYTITEAAKQIDKPLADACDLLYTIADHYDPPSPKPEPTNSARAEVTPKSVAYIDGGARGNPGPAGYGVVVLNDQGQIVARISKPIGHTTNNVAEYSGLLAALEKAVELGIKHLEIRSDSQLLVKQMQGVFKVKAKNLIPMVIQAKKLAGSLSSVVFTHVPRESNKEADRLANKAMDQIG